MSSDNVQPDASKVPLSATGIFLCGEPCGVDGVCRNGVLSARQNDDDSISYELECPDSFREMPGMAHTSWTAGIMSEICGQAPLWSGVIAFTGTVTTRYQAAVRVGERLIGRVAFDRREGRKIFVTGTLTSASTGVEVASGSAILIAAEMRNLEDRGYS